MNSINPYSNQPTAVLNNAKYFSQPVQRPPCPGKGAAER